MIMMSDQLSDYQYDLPSERIALHPLEERDQSKLLVYKKGAIAHKSFANIPEQLPAEAFLFFNNTRVIPARLHFIKETGAVIEVFLLNPVRPSSVVPIAMEAKQHATWKCKIGNLKKWTSDLKISQPSFELTARLANRDEGLVDFSWNGDLTFAEVIKEIGKTPLPPYIKREAVTEDRSRYQTIYSSNDGAVAAPTAGLHFTERVFSQLAQKNIKHDFLTLHVSAGTFLPVKSEIISNHTMHEEQMVITRQNLENILENREIIAVGTTSMRTLESIYWFGVKLLRSGSSTCAISQDEAYLQETDVERDDSVRAILDFMEKENLEAIIGTTSIFIRPGYRFRVCSGLVTNFHQPGSTLIMLVAAFVGADWRKIYEEAMQNHYRFLSYGDSSLLLP